ncbi:MAG: hypothetical protein IMW85_00900 [Thermicanus sp.]|nr:hypothetical protein [Thermicanus sp.]
MDLTWTPVNGATTYRWIVNGAIYGEVAASSSTIWTPGDNDLGYFRLQALDANGNVLAESNEIMVDGLGTEADKLWVNEFLNGSGSPPATGTCDGCSLIEQMLSCPYWDQYMGEWQRMIAGAIPPPPDWNAVSQTFSDAIVPRLVNDLRNMLGYAPDAPTKGQIDSQLPSSQPSLNTSVPDADLQPQNPFNGVQQFDISNAPEIPIVDESQPFSFTDPVQNLNPPDVAKKIYPGESTNSSEIGGVQIGNPGTIETVTPTPSTPPGGPIDPAPSPGQNGDGSYPTPTPSEPYPEKRYYKDIP